MTEVTFTETPPDSNGETPPASPLLSLRARRKALVEDLFTDLKVPRWDDDGGAPIYVRYRPVKISQAKSRMDSREKQKDKEAELLAACDVLVEHCQGVYISETQTGESEPRKLSLREGDPYGEWTRFDPDLAAVLLEESAPSNSVAVIRALYLTDGDLLNAFGSLMQWSGQMSEEAEKTHRGN